MSRRATAVAAALISATTGLGLLVPVAPASAAPVVSVAPQGDPADPQVVRAEKAEPVRVVVTTSDPLSDVQVTATGTGLDTASLGPLAVPAGATTLNIPVRSTSPGFHDLTVTVTASGAAPATTTVSRLWAAGGPHLAATGSLAGRTLGFDAPVVLDGMADRQQQVITFLSSSTAVVGLETDGIARCTKPRWSYRTCLRYAYDATTGLLEIGKYIGRVSPGRILVDGLADPGDQDEGFTPATFTVPLAVPNPRKRIVARWLRDAGGPVAFGLSSVVLSLDNARHYKLHTGRPGAKRYVERGSYVVQRDGRVTLDPAGRARPHDVGLLLVARPNGKPLPNGGAWLAYTDGEGRSAETRLYPLG